jgi:hypothetical protein
VSALTCCALAVALGVFVSTVAAQEVPTRVYLPDRADEDWSFLKTAARIDVWDPLKYIALPREDWFVTLSGEIRYRPEGFRIRPTEERPSTSDGYLLQRYLAGADVRLGPRARLFAEVQSGLVNGRLRSPRPTDQNSVDLHQGFVEWRHRSGERLTSIKAGRQELAIGSTRLISASPGLNVKRSFDGVSGVTRSRSWAFAAAAARGVQLEGGAFDDSSDSGQTFWGVAGSRTNPWLLQGELGVYYLGLDRSSSFYAQGSGPEQRHTIGLKWTRARSQVTWNYDGLIQWGTFAGASIQAWAFATETAFQVSSAGWRPRVSVRADVASGDRDAKDPALQAFNPLFPGNSYSGAVGLLGPTNLTDFTPAVTLQPARTLTLGFEAPSYWRTTLDDGVYATDLRLLLRPETGEGRYVGTNPGILVVWQATRHLQVQGVVTRFVAGRFLDDTFLESGFGFYSGTMLYRF